MLFYKGSLTIYYKYFDAIDDNIVNPDMNIDT